MDTSEPLPRSAFSNVIKSKNLETSPPLSPASSMSSIADETSLNAASDTSLNTTPKTPSTTFMNAFPTPPSGSSSTSTIPPYSNDSSPSSCKPNFCLIAIWTKMTFPVYFASADFLAVPPTMSTLSTLLVTTSLQQPHVSSTTEQSFANSFMPRIRPISLEASLADPNFGKSEEIAHENSNRIFECFKITTMRFNSTGIWFINFVCVFIVFVSLQVSNRMKCGVHGDHGQFWSPASV